MGIDITRQSQLERERRKMITHLNQYINWERLTNQALTRILQENDFEKMVVEILDLIGRAAQADRCYIFRYLDETGYRTVHEHSWRRDGAASLAEYKKVEIDLHDFPATRARLSADTNVSTPSIMSLRKETGRRNSAIWQNSMSMPGC